MSHRDANQFEGSLRAVLDGLVQRRIGPEHWALPSPRSSSSDVSAEHRYLALLAARILLRGAALVDGDTGGAVAAVISGVAGELAAAHLSGGDGAYALESLVEVAAIVRRLAHRGSASVLCALRTIVQLLDTSDGLLLAQVALCLTGA